MRRSNFSKKLLDEKKANKTSFLLFARSFFGEADLFYVSPEAQEDDKVGLVYKIKLRPKRYTLRVEDKDIPISPGMAVTAEIKTGKRRVIEFFLSPLIKHVDESLTLR